MPVTVKYSGALLEITMFGDVRPSELSEHLVQVESIERHEAVTPDRITDLTQAVTLQLKFNDVYELAEKRRREKLKNQIKSAIVVGNDLQFGVARTFQMINDNPQITLRIFRDRAQALAWLEG